ncbi:c(7)-type cytochrome triheme domain-containing protein [Thiolapillus sp.]
MLPIVTYAVLPHRFTPGAKRGRAPAMLLLLFIFSAPCSAGNQGFREQFTTNYKNFQFNAQQKLIKETEAKTMQAEIHALIAEAMEPKKTYPQRMYLLDIASAMASGYQHWHGDIKALTQKIDKLMQMELKQEEARVAKLMRWKKEERFLGNFVMKEHMEEMEKQNMAPVLYPHWVHRIWFECKVCHQDIFIMNRWRNNISHQQFDAGKQCGACHDGTMAFGVKDKKQCNKCHLAGKTEAEKLHTLSGINHDEIQTVAKRFGAEWNLKNLPDGNIPIDKFGFIDWLSLKRNKVFNPIHSLRKNYKHKARSNKILFESKGNLDDVIFDHEIHSNWINCSSCHPEIFLETLTNDVKMIRMSKGKHCGYCHGKVSFTFASCKRCHNRKKGAPRNNMLIHKGKNSD